MNQTEEAVISTLVYFDLLNRPLTNIELFRFLNKPPSDQPQLSFGQFLSLLKNIAGQTSLVKEYQGFYFLKEADEKQLFGLRQKRTKVSQLKWKRAKRIARILELTPFLEMIGITGSLSLDNALEESDIDLLIALEPGRLWIGRLWVTIILSLCGLRRHHQKTKDRACLNCYLASPSLEIQPYAKPHDLHSAQEYGRLICLWQSEQNNFSYFQSANAWINKFLVNYPWPDKANPKTAKANPLLAFIRGALEYPLARSFGDWLERRLGNWQI
ncbi:MAG: hypothetical protein HY764_04100 [Candidatus Portnoybacteria bacterium]|nr:hypothetical protein [Candidatus Portnoybacteria bacterium]